MDGTFTKKEVQAIKDKAYKVKSIKNGNESNSQYFIDNDDVWVATLKIAEIMYQ